MSRSGIWQLRKLKLQYCDFGGSSRGMREFLETRLPEFQKKNPQVLVDVVKRRNRHPHLSGEYLIGREKSVGVGGLEADEVEHYIYHLRNQWGLKSRRLGAGQIVSQRRSVQGVWNPFVKYD
ncbi:mitochondrial ribosomal protein L51/S25/CIB8 family protein [Acanthamoeba castellanii str. Neff]|uniref:Large ribosomal subunit protein mL43 n=1 Tax=Acanthamoeba castellanii (strain ATCC 30010 / Neff) TaxID=1257118 RepID=L8GCN2_ACACF|nr:mitochondrial ribosomal protein L51/S25/CIB8 family protein [Acanthamoeba castellanii str. Neff]ELR10837.1 mitochondrial ribosomal protein L51/S25/CIB8 family protein [Acanthamoeba castellanii str. Neff]